MSLTDFNKQGISWTNLPIKLWYPNGLGSAAALYAAHKVADSAGAVHDSIERRVGFKHVTWQKCKDSHKDSDPWICVANGQPFFLQGANWTPIWPNFADVAQSEYRKRLKLYHDLGFNIMRVWGGAFLEKEWFYDMCDELGIFVGRNFRFRRQGSAIAGRPTMIRASRK